MQFMQSLLKKPQLLTWVQSLYFQTGIKVLKYAFVLALFILLIFGTLHLPQVAANGSHDPGSQLALEYYFTHGTKFGIEIVQNTGPYGFLSYPHTFGGLTHWLKICFALSYSITFSILIIWTFARFKETPFRISFAVMLFFFVQNQETPSYLFFLLAMLLMVDSNPSYLTLSLKFLVTLFLPIFALTKSTGLAASTFILGLGCANLMLKRKWVIVLALLFIFVASLAFLWFMAGQAVYNIIPFLSNAIDFSDVYNDAMTIDESEIILIAAIVTLLAILIRLIYLLKVAFFRRDFPTAAASFFIGFVTFVAWKHGYVRADQWHVAIFYFYILPALPIIFVAKLTPDQNDTTALLVSRLAVFVILAGIGTATLRQCGWQPQPMFEAVTSNLSVLADLRAHLAQLKQQLQINKEKEADALRNIKEAVRSSTIDEFGITPGTMIMSDFNYKPRPIPVRFIALGADFQRKNADFYKDPLRAPQYVLTRDDEIDGRLLSQDDALAFIELLTKYKIVTYGPEGILLKRSGEDKTDAKYHYIQETPAAFDEIIPIPSDSAEFVFTCVTIRRSLLGALVRALYKSPEVDSVFHLVDPVGRKSLLRRKFIPYRGGSCFMSVPLMETNRDILLGTASDRRALERLMNARVPWGIEFNIVGQKGMFAPKIDVRFMGISGILPQEVKPKIVAKEFFSSNVIPIGVEAVEMRPIVAYGRSATLLHAPAKIEFHKDQDVSLLSAEFGLVPSAFENGGSSDGIEVSVEFIPSEKGARRTLFSQTLDPVAVAKDRGIQKLTVALPKDENGTVSIHFRERSNAAFDHSFVNNVQLE